MKSLFYSTLSALSLTCMCVQASDKTPQQALDTLLEGNRRFVNNQSNHPSYFTEAKSALVQGQTPFAAIICCSDSRVPPELIFDCGLGELFIVRDAGNVIGPIESDSVEFSAFNLGVPLIMVLGHQNCAAVNASLQGADALPNILPLIDKALENCDTSVPNPLKQAIECNVAYGVKTLKSDPEMASLIKQKKLRIVGAYYDIKSGKVTLTSY